MLFKLTTQEKITLTVIGVLVVLGFIGCLLV